MITLHALMTGHSFEDIAMSDYWQSIFMAVAIAMDLNTSDVEDLHAAHKGMAAPGAGMELLASSSVLRQIASASRHLQHITTPTEDTVPMLGWVY